MYVKTMSGQVHFGLTPDEEDHMETFSLIKNCMRLSGLSFIHNISEKHCTKSCLELAFTY